MSLRLENRGKCCIFVTLGIALALGGCGRTPPVTHAAVIPETVAPPRRQIRSTGTVQASHVFSVQIPQIVGQNGRITLTRLVPNGCKVNKGDALAEFDRTQQLDNGRDAKAKFEDL